MLRSCFGLALLLANASLVSAASPESIVVGKQLFEHEWTPRNPALGSDGLGPLFNARSCATCHQLGGVGGAGGAQFNAKMVGIETMKIEGGPVSNDTLVRMIKGFHPGFVDPKAGVVNTLPLAHFGGSPLFSEARENVLSQTPAQFSEHGGPVDAAEVRRANATPILYSAQSGGYSTTIRARLFQRNTTALFGAGLIDQVTSKQLKAIEREQKKHPEISGRLATLADGRLGRFGWRANIPTLLDFCDQACAAEVGLETRRKVQPPDATMPGYSNPSTDINDQQIRAMADFVSALPQPVRKVPTDPKRRLSAARGEQLFASIGCAVCHRPNIGPANGIYSDLLLHEMGEKSYDLSPPDPYIRKLTPVTRVDYDVTTQTQSSEQMVNDTAMGNYYGNTYSMQDSFVTENISRSVMQAGQRRLRPRSSVTRTPQGYLFSAAPTPPLTMRIIPQGSNSRDFTIQSSQSSREERRLGDRFGGARVTQTASGSETFEVDSQVRSTSQIRETRTHYLRGHIEPTLFTQEWRTPPLWGVADSAPYMHDGRAETLLEAITMHGGESQGTKDRFLHLSWEDREAVLDFLGTLVAPGTTRPSS
ncbi:MAG: di-heme oxidoredictase family protein [Planctomycetota bacterium]